MRLGIFGGSFDPVHLGHLALARACHEQAQLDEVWFTPTAVQPLKHQGPHASDADRVEMLRLAIDSALSAPDQPRPHVEAAWRVCTLEVDRGGRSYTVETLRQLYEELPTAKLFFMIGADAVRDVPQWKDPGDIFQHTTPLIVCRPGQPTPDLTSIAPLCTAGTQPRLISMPLVNVSSTEIRSRIASGEPIDDMVPPAVAEYIAQRGIYR